MPRTANLGCISVVFGGVACAGAAPAAETVANLYTATVRVTGQGEETRGPALVKALETVLVKVSGDPGFEHDLAVEAIAVAAPALATGYAYRDRMAGIPVHDEQGSRDRPYDLTVSFDAAAIDATLEGLGDAPWNGPRPELLALVAVEIGDARFTLTADGARGRDMREAMLAAAEQFGMPVMLPTEAMAGAGFPEGATVPSLVEAAGADVAVSGTLAWSEADLGWEADWRLAVDDVPYRWQAHRVSFDDAFRSAIGGAAQILSGHGAPD